MKKRYGGVYRITAPNGEFYIGSSNYIARRWIHHVGAMRNGKHGSRKLQAVADTYGVDSLVIEVLYCAIADDALWQVEQQYIDDLRPTLNTAKRAKTAMHDATTRELAKAAIAVSPSHAVARLANQKLASKGISRAIVRLEDGAVFESSYEAARACGVGHKDSMATAANKGWRCGGYYWAWLASGITLADRLDAAAKAEDARKAASAASMIAARRRGVRRELDGQEFYSIAEAARQVGCHHTAIHRAASTGGKANGSRWAYV